MATHRDHSEISGVYFVTFTCCQWRSLFEVVGLYNYFDNWFQYLKNKKVDLVGYVIMPNHFHGLIHIPDKCELSLNKLVGNGKRFLAYEIITRLRNLKEDQLLSELANLVSSNQRKKGKLHEVFRLSFDARLCFNQKMLLEKLDYIHHNPVAGKWNLVDDWIDYPYSSARFYETDEVHPYLVHYKDLN